MFDYRLLLLILGLFLAISGVYFISNEGDWFHGVCYLFQGLPVLVLIILILIMTETKKKILLYALFLILATPVFWLLLTDQFLIVFFGWLQ